MDDLKFIGSVILISGALYLADVLIRNSFPAFHRSISIKLKPRHRKIFAMISIVGVLLIACGIVPVFEGEIWIGFFWVGAGLLTVGMIGIIVCELFCNNEEAAKRNRSNLKFETKPAQEPESEQGEAPDR